MAFRSVLVRAKKFVAPSLLAILTTALLVQLPLAIASRASDYDLFDPVIEVRSIIQRLFVDESRIDDEQMRKAMIDGMLATLDDPHTVYVPPADVAEFNKDMRGTYVGIGCEVNIIDDYLTIVSPMDGSPALEAGVMAGDVVLEIEGESTLKMPITECVDRLMGEPGTKVTIKVRHLDGTEQTYTITRRPIVTRTVKGLRREGENWNYCISDQLGLSYVRVTQFNESTVQELRNTLDQMQTRGINGLVLDLRDNPGGGLLAAVQTADLFLSEGTIVSVRPRRGDPVVYTAHRKGTLPDFPMIVLVNGHSASASEIVAGALQENGRAKVLGTRTFGKGSVQEVRELDYNRGTLKFTTAHYHLPSGRNINRASDSTVWGVDPDPGMVVAITDEQYVDRIRARREFEVIRNGSDTDSGTVSPPCADPQWIRENLKDEELARAVEALSARLTTGEWPAVGDDNAGAAAFDLELARAVRRRSELAAALNDLEKRISELRQVAADAGRPPLLPPDVDLAQGTITIRDKYGNVIGTYRIEGGDVELALNSVRVTPIEQ